jgi:hypothetical protein
MAEAVGVPEGHLGFSNYLLTRGTSLFDGYSEAWSKSTFEVSTIKQLFQLTEEFETYGKTR